MTKINIPPSNTGGDEKSISESILFIGSDFNGVKIIENQYQKDRYFYFK